MNKIGLIAEPDHVKEISRAFESVKRDIRQSLLNFNVGDFSEIKAVKMQTKLNRTLDALDMYSARWARRSTTMAYIHAKNIAKTRLEILGARRQPDFDQLKHKNSIMNHAAVILKDFKKATEKIRQYIQGYIYFARKSNQGLMQIQAFVAGIYDEEVIGGIIEETIALGKARGYASKLIANYLSQNLMDGNYIQIGSRMYNVKDYAELVARTKLREAQTAATKATCEEYDNDLVLFSQHDNPCDDCAQYEGEVYSLSGKSSTYPMLPAEPPIHPNCEHTISPTSETALKYR